VLILVQGRGENCFIQMSNYRLLVQEESWTGIIYIPILRVWIVEIAQWAFSESPWDRIIHMTIING
jgi:hypothetical protein